MVQSPAKVRPKTMTAAAATAAPDGDADDARLGERVAEHALHECAGDGERGADEGGHGDAWEADGPEGVVAARVRGHRQPVDAEAVQEGPGDLVGRDRQLSGPGRDHQRRDQPGGEQDQEGGDPERARAPYPWARRGGLRCGSGNRRGNDGGGHSESGA